MADERELDPMAAKLAAEMSTKTFHSLSKRQRPQSAWIEMEVKEETLHCLNCSYGNFGIDGLKCHMLRQHPGTAAVVSNCSSEEALSMPDVTFFCVKKTCPHSSTICYVYEDHLMRCCSLPLDLTQEEKESLKATLQFLMNFHKRHTLRIASGFVQFVSTLPEGISSSEYNAYSDSEDQKVNGRVADISDVKLEEIRYHDDSPTYDLSQNGHGQNLGLHDMENLDIAEGETMLTSSTNETDFSSDCAIFIDPLAGSHANIANDCEIKILNVGGCKGAVGSIHKNVSNVQPKEKNHHISKLDFTTAHLSSTQNPNFTSVQMSFSDTCQKSQDSPPLKVPKFTFDSSHIVSTKQSLKPPAEQSVKRKVIARISGPKVRFDSSHIMSTTQPPAEQFTLSKSISGISRPKFRFDSPASPKFRLDSPAMISQTHGARFSATKTSNETLQNSSNFISPIEQPFKLFNTAAFSSTQSADFSGTQMSVNKSLLESNQTHQYSNPQVEFSSPPTEPPVNMNISSQKTPQHNTIRQGTIMRKVKTLPQNILKILSDKNCKFLPINIADGKVNTASSANEAKSYLSSLILPQTASKTGTSQLQVIVLQPSKADSGTPTGSNVLTQITSLSNNKPKQTTVKPIPFNVQNKSNFQVLSNNSLKSSSPTCQASSVKPGTSGQIGIQSHGRPSTTVANTSEAVSNNSLKSSSPTCEASSVKPGTSGQIGIQSHGRPSTTVANTSEAVAPVKSPSLFFDYLQVQDRGIISNQTTDDSNISDSSKQSTCDDSLEESHTCLAHSDEEYLPATCESEDSSDGPLPRGLTCQSVPSPEAKTTDLPSTSLNSKTTSAPKQKRVYDKKHSCVYCNKLYTKLARHLEQKHASEVEVAFVLSLPKKSKIRKVKWQELLKKGDFIYNKQVLKQKGGLIIPCKRSSNVTDSVKYLPCVHCYGMYLKNDLWRHVKNCHGKNAFSKSNINHQTAGKMFLPISSDVSKRFRKSILSTMVLDEVASIVMSDPLILAFGERLFTKASAQQHKYDYVKQKLRELGRFLLCVKSSKSTDINHLRDCIDPEKFKLVVSSVRKLCKYDEDGNYGIPSLAVKIGHSLMKCALLLKSQALQWNDEELKQKAASFLDLYTSDWAVELSSMSLQTIPKRIPLAHDLKLLNSYLEDKACTLKKTLESDLQPSIEIWKELSEVTLCQMVLFNRRRGGETERISLSNYTEGLANNRDMQEEVFASLTPFERQLASNLDTIEISGKRGRKVPVLLTKNHMEQIDCLIKHRATVGVNSENKFLFARCGDALTSIRSSDVLREYATTCGAKEPSLLTSTALREHVANISQILNLKKHELDTLANFLGHDIQVHQNFYHLPEDTVQLAKVSKILVELENGNTSKYAGKSLDEVEMDDNEEFDENELQPHISEEREEIDGPPTLRGEKEIISSLLSKKSDTSQSINRKMKTRAPRMIWSSDEKAAVERQLGKYFTLTRLPGKYECEEAKLKEPILQKRPWMQIKFFIKNTKVSRVNQRIK